MPPVAKAELTRPFASSSNRGRQLCVCRPSAAETRQTRPPTSVDLEEVARRGQSEAGHLLLDHRSWRLCIESRLRFTKGIQYYTLASSIYYYSVCACQHIHINSFVSAPLNATKIAVMKCIHGMAESFILAPRLAPRSVFYGHNRIEEPERSRVTTS